MRRFELLGIAFALAAGGALLPRPRRWRSGQRRRRPARPGTATRRGHGYVGVQVNSHWAPPQQQGQAREDGFYSEWVGQGNPSPYCHAYWVIVHRTSDGSAVNSASPEATTVCGPQSAIRVDAGGFADMSLYLDVAVDPVTAPARTDRTVTAQLTAGWQAYLGKAISAYVIPSSVREARWTRSTSATARAACSRTTAPTA
ncbi:MAG: hypothetical protein U0838_02390 [Chloroflexota bacterium]